MDQINELTERVVSLTTLVNSIKGVDHRDEIIDMLKTENKNKDLIILNLMENQKCLLNSNHTPANHTTSPKHIHKDIQFKKPKRPIRKQHPEKSPHSFEHKNTYAILQDGNEEQRSTGNDTSSQK